MYRLDLMINHYIATSAALRTHLLHIMTQEKMLNWNNLHSSPPPTPSNQFTKIIGTEMENVLKVLFLHP